MTLAALALLFAPLACTSADADVKAPASPPPKVASADPTAEVRVELARLTPSEAQVQIQIPAEVRGARDALLASASGGFVEKVHVREGQEVKAGQILVSIDARSAAARKEQAEAQAQLAEAEVARLEQMGDLVSRQQLDQARTQQRLAKANLDLARIGAERAQVRAPFDGVVGQISLEPGEIVAPGSPVARVVELDRVELSLSVADRDVVGLREGMAVMVQADATAHSHRGTIQTISPAADLQTRTFLVKAIVENPERDLLPGMIARVNLAESLEGTALVIPQDWLVTRIDGIGVFVADGEIARWRPVKPGRVIGDRVVIDEGLQPDETIVTTGQRKLMDGDRLLVARSGVCCTAGRVVY